MVSIICPIIFDAILHALIWAFQEILSLLVIIIENSSQQLSIFSIIYSVLIQISDKIIFLKNRGSKFIIFIIFVQNHRFTKCL